MQIVSRFHRGCLWHVELVAPFTVERQHDEVYGWLFAWQWRWRSHTTRATWMLQRVWSYGPVEVSCYSDTRDHSASGSAL